MRLLLDTHIWLWLTIDPKRLGRGTLKILKDEENELWLSPISTWEALTLHHKGRVELHGDLSAWVSRATAGINEALPTHEIMNAARQLPMHQDRSDRMLAATALVLETHNSRRTVTRFGKYQGPRESLSCPKAIYHAKPIFVFFAKLVV